MHKRASSCHRGGTDLAQEIRAGAHPRVLLSPEPPAVQVTCRLFRGPAPKGCWPAAAAPGQDKGLGCSSVHTCCQGCNADTLSSTLHCQSPFLGLTSTFQPAPPAQGCAAAAIHLPPCPVPAQSVPEQGDPGQGPGTAGSEPRTWVLSPLPCALRAALSSMGHQPQASCHQQILHRGQERLSRLPLPGKCWTSTLNVNVQNPGHSQSTGAGLVLSCLNVWLCFQPFPAEEKGKKSPKGRGLRSSEKGH